MLRKILIAAGSVLLVLVVGGGVFVSSRQNLRFDDTPYPDVAASTDSAVIARGRYIVRDVAPCAGCHGDPAQRAAYVSGADVPLVGGFAFDIPPGKFYTRNLTPDSATGLGNVSDRAIARALRFGVGHDGRALLPFMEMQGLADDDLQAVVSYLRTQPPVHNPVPAAPLQRARQVVKATVLSKPVGPSSPPLAQAPRGASESRTGRYLVESVALCWACHTERSQMTGALTGPRFGGTQGFTRGRRSGALVVAAEHHERSGNGAAREDERGPVRRSLPPGAIDPRVADAVAGLLAHERRRPPGDLPLPQDRAGGEARQRAADGQPGQGLSTGGASSRAPAT